MRFSPRLMENKNGFRKCTMFVILIKKGGIIHMLSKEGSANSYPFRFSSVLVFTNFLSILSTVLLLEWKANICLCLGHVNSNSDQQGLETELDYENKKAFTQKLKSRLMLTGRVDKSFPSILSVSEKLKNRKKKYIYEGESFRAYALLINFATDINALSAAFCLFFKIKYVCHKCKIVSLGL